MKDDNERSVTVGSIGMDERSRAALGNAFEAFGNEALVLVKDEEPADVTVVDLVGSGADQQWREHQRRWPDRPVVLLSLRDYPIESETFLRKPVKVDELLGAIRRAAGIAEQPSPRPVEAASAPLARLRIVSGPSTGTVQELARPFTPVGQLGSQVAVIARRRDGYALIGIPKNSVAVNGELVQDGRYVLKDGDVIQIGGLRMEFTW
jgi:hypothetical protein